MNRRTFLSTMAGLGGLGLSSRLWATETRKINNQFLVFIYFPGGWDTTLCTDPWTQDIRPDPKDIFLEYRQDELLNWGSLTLGPAMNMMQPHAQDLCVVNGVFMNISDNGHDAALLYMQSGDPLLKSPHAGVDIHLSTPSAPFGFLTNEPVSTAGQPTGLCTFSEIKNITKIENPLLQMQAIAKFARGNSELLEAIFSVVNSSSEFEKLVGLVRQIESTGASLTDADILKSAFLSGSTAIAHYNVDVFNQSLDTHGNHPGAHMETLKSHWQKVADLFKLFKETSFGDSGESLFDRTTFVVLSEFSRTPFLNPANGKDHNPFTNSAVLAGRKIRGGQCLGASKLIEKSRSKIGASYQIAKPFDFSLQVAADSRNVKSFISPESVIRTLAEVMDVDWSRFQNVPQSTAFLTAALKR